MVEFDEVDVDWAAVWSSPEAVHRIDRERAVLFGLDENQINLNELSAFIRQRGIFLFSTKGFLGEKKVGRFSGLFFSKRGTSEIQAVAILDSESSGRSPDKTLTERIPKPVRWLEIVPEAKNYLIPSREHLAEGRMLLCLRAIHVFAKPLHLSDFTKINGEKITDKRALQSMVTVELPKNREVEVFFKLIEGGHAKKEIVT